MLSWDSRVRRKGGISRRLTNAALTAAIVRLATRYGRYGYRRMTGLFDAALRLALRNKCF